MPGTTHREVVLITGCSSGIGRAAAIGLHKAGLRVYATARQAGTLADLANVSSMGGRATLPGGAFYHASKYAVEALSDALRMEVAQFGIDVILIEPGPVKTPWNQVAAASMSTAVPGALDDGASGSNAEATADPDPYLAYKSAVGASFADAQTGLLARLGSTAEDIATVITHAVTTPRPRTRYLIGPIAKSVVTMNRLLPGRAYNTVLRRQYRLPH